MLLFLSYRLWVAMIEESVLWLTGLRLSRLCQGHVVVLSLYQIDDQYVLGSMPQNCFMLLFLGYRLWITMIPWRTIKCSKLDVKSKCLWIRVFKVYDMIDFASMPILRGIIVF